MTEKYSRTIWVARYLAIIWITLSLAEAMATYFCLEHPGMFEANPLARSLWARSEVLFYGIKLLITISVGAGFWLLSTRIRHVKAMIVSEVILITIFTGVLLNNILHL